MVLVTPARDTPVYGKVLYVCTPQYRDETLHWTVYETAKHLQQISLEASNSVQPPFFFFFFPLGIELYAFKQKQHRCNNAV